jgi:predicted membrane protein
MALYTFGTGSPRQGGNNPFGSLGCLLTVAVIFGTIYYFFKMLYSNLWVGPAFLLIALVINWKVVAGLGKSLINLFKKDILIGILTCVLCVFGFPIVALLLIFAALAGKRVEEFQKQFSEQMNFRGGGQTDFDEEAIFGQQQNRNDEPIIKEKKSKSIPNTTKLKDNEDYIDYEEIK